MCRAQLVILASLLLLIVCSNSRGERVGFTFAGQLQGGSTGTYNLFGISVPKNSSVTGTFSYDTTAQGLDGEPGMRSYQQLIAGGYTLNINNGAIRMSASDFRIDVTDDFQRQMPGETVDTFDVAFDSRFNLTPSPLVVNGNSWAGATAFMRLELSWPWSTFADADEPKLTPDRPLTPNFSNSAYSTVGSGTPRLFSISSISAIAPLAGDYNRDGTIDASDYAEWRQAFGESGEACLFADGNNSAVVDAADYVIWRDALGPSGAFSIAPEPSSLGIMAAGLFLCAAWFRRCKCWT
jgi:hypothetical protein